MIKLQPITKLSANSMGGLLLAVAVGVFFVFYTFGYQFVIGKSSFWDSQVSDVTQYVSGFNAYFRAPWKLPLLEFDSINYPAGTRVTFVDAIPLYALFLKLVIPQSWAPFSPFGFWVGLSFVLQCIGAWWILKELKINSWAALVLIISLCVTYPALLRRLGHISLMSHWIILFAFALYLRGRTQNTIVAAGWTALLTVSFYINIYLTCMASAILVSLYFSLPKKTHWVNVLGFLSPFVLIGLTTLVTIFPLSASQVAPEGGFGFYSMNVLSPIMGGKFISINAGMGEGQYEGFNYLGIGLIIAVAWVYTFRRKEFDECIRQNRPLTLVLLAFIIYSLSSNIYIGSNEVAVIKYPEFLNGFTSQFRVSGRFFWSVGYAAIIIVVMILHGSLRKNSFLLVAVLIAGIQIADIKPIYLSMKAKSDAERGKPLDTERWSFLLHKEVQNIYYYPKFKCGAKPMETLLPVMGFAGNKGYRLNTGYIARYTPDCNDAATEIGSSDPRISAYVFSKIEYPTQDSIKPLFRSDIKVSCELLQFAYVCQQERD